MSWFFALGLFVSAALLFFIQPIVGKLLLPKFGGTPFVWATCMLFFQAALLAGYAYVHLTTARLKEGAQKRSHVVVLIGAILTLPLAWIFWPFAAAPLGIADSWAPPGEGQPVFWLILVLALTIGLPFFALAASAPLLQRWFAATGKPSARDPYYLYAASNLGSLSALLAYPWLVEPLLGVSAQGWFWLVGLVVAAALVLGCLALVSWQTSASDAIPTEQSESPPDPEAKPVIAGPATSGFTSAIRAQSPNQFGLAPRNPLPEEVIPSVLPAEPEVTAIRRIGWVVHAFVPSSLMLALTTHFTTDIAPVPLFWVIPLAVYVFTMVVAFARLPTLVYRIFVLVMPVTVVAALFVGAGPLRMRFQPLTPFYFHLATLLVVGVAFHGRIAQTRPRTPYLTEFFVWLALGGLLGGVFNAVLAPLLFRTTVEYEMTLILACLLMPALDNGRPVQWVWIPTSVLFVALTLAGLLAYELGRTDALRELFADSPAEAALALAALLLSCPLAAIAAPFVARKERVDAAFDFMLPAAVAVCTVFLLLGMPRRPSTAGELTPLVFVYVLVLLATLARLILSAIQGQLFRSLLLGWPVLLALSVTVKLALCLVDDSSLMMTDPVSLSPAFYRLGLPLLLAIISVDRPIRFGLSLAAVLLVYAIIDGDTSEAVYQTRSYFGISRVEKRKQFFSSAGVPSENYHRFLHGTTLQGMQCMDPDQRDEPLTYFHRTGPLGEVLGSLEKRDAPPPIAIIGLGIGAAACYGRSGQEITFYEIDPAVIRIARDPALFTHLSDADKRGVRLQTIAGDGRLQIARAPDGHFGAIVVDAFNSDAIPTHLLTREALALYVRKLAPGGVIILHVSNRYLDLPPILRDLADDAGLVVLERYDEDEKPPGKNSSDWVIIAQRQPDLDAVLDATQWKKPGRRGARIWTDDYSNIFDAFRRPTHRLTALEE